MRQIVQTLALATALSAAFGCRATELAYDQDHIRSAVMDLQTNQVMDNLIRYRNGLPILQLDYIHMMGTVTDTASGTLTGSQTVVGSKSLSGPTTALALSRMLTNVFNWGVAGMKVNQLTVTAEPVNTSPDVYQAYAKFMEKDGNLLEGPEPPPSGSYVLCGSCASCGGSSCHHWRHHPVEYYWVPTTAKEEFRDLAIHAVALRGYAVPSSPDYDVTIQRLEKPYQPDKNDPDLWYVRFQIDKYLPLDNGYMIVNIKGVRFDKKSYLEVDALPLDDPREVNVPSDARTNRFELSVRLGKKFKDLGINNISDITSVLAAPRTAQGGSPEKAGSQAGAPTQTGQTAAGAQVGIHLENHWPGMYSAENPAVSDVQNLLRLQYLSGFRNSSSTP